MAKKHNKSKKHDKKGIAILDTSFQLERVKFEGQMAVNELNKPDHELNMVNLKMKQAEGLRKLGYEKVADEMWLEAFNELGDLCTRPIRPISKEEI